MHLTIFNGAARPQAKSNTALILEAFCKGFEEKGDTAQVHHLSDRRQWEAARAAFDAGDFFLIALPLYVENIPGLLLEFLEGLEPKKQSGARMAFLVQGGFPEASQLRCCEAYLETLPGKLGCAYAGTLIRGNNFFLRLLKDKEKQQILALYENMGRRFSELECFDKDEVTAFAAPEYMPPQAGKVFHFIGKTLQKPIMNGYLRKMGGHGHLGAQPDAKEINKHSDR